MDIIIANYVGHKAYCFVCRIRDTYCSYDFELVKCHPVELTKLASELFEDVSLYYNFDNNLTLWNKDYEYKWKDISSGVASGILLKHCNYF